MKCQIQEGWAKYCQRVLWAQSFGPTNGALNYILPQSLLWWSVKINNVEWDIVANNLWVPWAHSFVVENSLFLTIRQWRVKINNEVPWAHSFVIEAIIQNSFKLYCHEELKSIMMSEILSQIICGSREPIVLSSGRLVKTLSNPKSMKS